MDSLKDILHKVHRFEQAYQVNSIKINGIYAWPLMRKLLWVDFMNKNIVRRTPEAKKEKERKYSKIKWIKKFQLQKEKGELLKQFQSNVKSLDLDGDNLLYSSTFYLTDNIEGKLYDRHIDPLKQFFFPRATKIVERDSLKNTWFENKNFGLDILDKAGPIEAELGTHPNHKLLDPQGILPDFEREFNVDPHAHRFKLNRIFYLSSYLEEALKNKKVHRVLLPCWYDDYSLALILACKKNGIKTIDVQHGKQGRYHCMYTHFCNIPEGGYELLPDYFFSWNEDYAENINQWMGNGSHHAVVVGNPWIAAWKENLYPFKHEFLDEITELRRTSKIYLISLQPINEILPPYFVEFIKEQNNFFFLLRLHPLQKNDEDVRSYLRSIASNVNIEESSDLPLYSLLPLVDYHSTAWSSVAFESVAYEIPTAIHHKIGHELYENEIKDNVFTTVNSRESLQGFVDGSKSESSNLKPFPKMKEIEENLKKIEKYYFL